jgi:hypothetical protein
MQFVALVVVASCFLADDPPQDRQGSLSAFEPGSGPAAGQEFLARFTGEWDVSKVFYPRAGEPLRTRGRCRQSMIHAGRFLQSDFVFEQGVEETTGLGIIGFDPDSGTFTSFWTDSPQTRFSVRQSRDRFDGERLVLYSRSLDGDGQESRRSKTVSHLEEGGRKLIHRQYALGPGREERLMMELVMTRRVDASPPRP